LDWLYRGDRSSLPHWLAIDIDDARLSAVGRKARKLLDAQSRSRLLFGCDLDLPEGSEGFMNCPFV